MSGSRLPPWLLQRSAVFGVVRTGVVSMSSHPLLRDEEPLVAAPEPEVAGALEPI
jgi:hypothetical protein